MLPGRGTSFRTRCSSVVPLRMEQRDPAAPRRGARRHLVLDTRDAADGYYTPTSTSRDTAARGPVKGHPLSGPSRCAAPGPATSWSSTSSRWSRRRSAGLTSARAAGSCRRPSSRTSFLQIWNLEDGAFARMRASSGARVAVPLAPFPGSSGPRSTSPAATARCRPGRTAGTWTSSSSPPARPLYLPVWVEGGLLSVGDAHGAQGDGEVCISAVEMSARVTLRVGLRQGRPLREPQLRTSRASPEPGRGVRDDGPRPRPLPLRPAGRPLPGRAPGRGARAHARGGLRRRERRRGPQDQRDRRRAELDRLGVHPGVDLRVGRRVRWGETRDARERPVRRHPAHRRR